MEYEILKFIFEEDSYKEVRLNDFLKEHYGDERCTKIREALYNLTSSGKITIKDEAQRYMCSMVRIPSNATQNMQATLDNWDLYATLKEPGRQFILEKNRQNRQDYLLEQQANINKTVGESSVNINNFTIRNTKKNNRLFWLTIAVAAAGALGTIRSCELSRQTNEREMKKFYQDTTIQSLQRKIEQTKNIISHQQILIDSMIRTLNDIRSLPAKTKLKSN